MASGTRRVAAVALSLVLGLLTLIGPLPGSKAIAQTGEQAEGFTIADGRIVNSSGLAADRARNVYWTANTTGSTGRAYALNSDGQVRGAFEFGARPLDVEAVAFAGDRLYVGDIGDKLANRQQVTVFHFANPSPGAGGGQYRSYDFSYPDGPKDAATLLVNQQGQIFVVSKGKPGGIYAAPAQPSSAGVNRLTRVADAPAYVTDGTVLRDGRVALRTYQGVQVLDSKTWKVQTSAKLPAQTSGESITQTLDGSALLVGSKGANSKVERVAVPNSRAEIPEGSKEPPGAEKPAAPESAEPTAEPTQEAVEDTDRSPTRGGTWLALGLALLASLGAAAVVYFRGRTAVDAGEPEDTAVLGRRVRTGHTGEIPVITEEAREQGVPSGTEAAPTPWSRPAAPSTSTAPNAPAPTTPAPNAPAPTAPTPTAPTPTAQTESHRAEDENADEDDEPTSQRPAVKSARPAPSTQNQAQTDQAAATSPRANPRRAHSSTGQAGSKAEPGHAGEPAADPWAEVLPPESDSSGTGSSGSQLMPRPRPGQGPRRSR